jgi:hypothetical protein
MHSGERSRAHVGQCFTSPQRERISQEGRSVDGPVFGQGASAVSDECVETDGIDVGPIEPVSPVLPFDGRLASDQLARARNGHAQRAFRVRREVGSPEVVDQLLGRHDPTGGEGEVGDQRAARRPQIVESAAVDRYPYRPENVDTNHRTTIRPSDTDRPSSLLPGLSTPRSPLCNTDVHAQDRWGRDREQQRRRRRLQRRHGSISSRIPAHASAPKNRSSNDTHRCAASTEICR